MEPYKNVVYSNENFRNIKQLRQYKKFKLKLFEPNYIKPKCFSAAQAVKHTRLKLVKHMPSFSNGLPLE